MKIKFPTFILLRFHVCTCILGLGLGVVVLVPESDIGLTCCLNNALGRQDNLEKMIELIINHEKTLHICHI